MNKMMGIVLVIVVLAVIAAAVWRFFRKSNKPNVRTTNRVFSNSPPAAKQEPSVAELPRQEPTLTTPHIITTEDMHPKEAKIAQPRPLSQEPLEKKTVPKKNVESTMVAKRREVIV